MTTKPFEQQIRILTGDDELDTAIAGFSTEQHTVLIDYPYEFSNEFTCRVHKYGRIPDLREPDCSFVGCFEVGELESLIPLLICSRDKINEVSQNWDRNALSEMIIGQRIKGLRLITPAEMKRENWEHWNTDGACVVIELENGTQIFPSRGSEGNGPGCLYGICPAGSSIYMIPTADHIDHDDGEDPES